MKQMTFDGQQHLPGRNVREVIEGVVKSNPDYWLAPKHVPDMWMKVKEETTFDPSFGTVDRTLRSIRNNS